jgi:hypothetical protein
MKKIIAVAVALVVIFAAAPAALACWSVASCNNPTGCTGTITYVQNPSVCWSAGWRPGQLHKTTSGQKCVWIAGSGSVGCTWGVRMYNGEGCIATSCGGRGGLARASCSSC